MVVVSQSLWLLVRSQLNLDLLNAVNMFVIIENFIENYILINQPIKNFFNIICFTKFDISLILFIPIFIVTTFVVCFKIYRDIKKIKNSHILQMGNSPSKGHSTEPMDDHIKNSQEARDKCRTRSKSCKIVSDIIKSGVEQSSGHNATYLGANSNMDDANRPMSADARQGDEGDSRNSEESE